jgi:hypothetical protein
MRATLVAALLLASAVSASAQVTRPSPAPPSAVPVSPEPAAAPFSGHIRLSAVLFDNFFQTPEGEPQDDVPAGSAEARVQKGFGSDLVAYGELEYTDYQDYRPSGGVVAGLRGEGRPHTFDLQAQVMLGRPSREVRDEFDRADGVAVVGQYGYRIGDFEPIALGEFRHETYELSPQKTNDVYNVGAALRVRMGKVSPEVGFRWGRRDVDDDDEDLRQREMYLRLRWAPARPTYVSLRLRRRLREYSIEDGGSTNFGREDTRDQLVASGDFFTTSRFGINVYYSVEDSDSSHDRGEFLTQMLAAGVVVRF